MSDSRPVAWQIGRHGEVAGGMTQVVNAYMKWPFERFRVDVIPSRDGSRGLRAWLLALRAFARVAGLPRNPTDHVFVVHLSQGGSFIREGLLLGLARWRGFGTVAHLHGSSFVSFAQRRPGLVRRVLAWADRVIVLSTATEAAVSSLLDRDRVVLIPNAVRAGAQRRKEQLVVFGGGVGRRKGIDVLVEAWRLVNRDRGWHLVVAGPVLDPEVVPDDLPDARFVGATSHATLMELLERSSIAVLPSRDEAMPMFILEAMGRSNCVISTRVGGIPAVLADGRGMLVPPDDVEALAAALDAAMRDDAKREQVAANGRAAFDAEYSAEAVYPRVETIWDLVRRNAVRNRSLS